MGARRLHAETLALDLARGDTTAAAVVRTNLGLIAALAGDIAAAAGDLGAALRSFADLGNQAGIIFCLSGVAALAGQVGRTAEAARMLGAVDALRVALQFPVSPSNRPHFDQLEALARGNTTPKAFAAARAAARAEPAAVAVELALALAPDLL